MRGGSRAWICLLIVMLVLTSVFPADTMGNNDLAKPNPDSTQTPSSDHEPSSPSGESPSSAPTPTPTPAPNPPPAPVAGVLAMNMKSYGNHDATSWSNTIGSATYDERILAIRPQYVIDNPPHGLYGEMDERIYHLGYTYSHLLQKTSTYQAAGVKVIGYVTCGYEGAGGGDNYDRYWYSLETNRMLITNMATLDHVDGVFIDEVTDYPDAVQKSYLKQLSDLAHSYGLIVWMNTGVDDFDEWYFTSNIADLMQSSEAWSGQYLSPVQSKWGSRISVTGFNSKYNAQDAYELTIDAWCKGIAYCYINDAEYTSIAPWFEEYAQKLRDWDGSCP